MFSPCKVFFIQLIYVQFKYEQSMIYIHIYTHLNIFSFPALLHLKVTRTTRRRKLKENSEAENSPSRVFILHQRACPEMIKIRDKIFKKLSTSYDWNATGSRVIKMCHRFVAENTTVLSSYVFLASVC